MNDSDFFSVDRLIEFGMSMAVAQQMIQSMNQTMQNMHIPGAMNAVSPPSSDYYAVVNGDRIGPLTNAEMLKLVENKSINRHTYMWKPGMANWEIAEQLPEVLKLVALLPPPIPKSNHDTNHES